MARYFRSRKNGSHHPRGITAIAGAVSTVAAVSNPGSVARLVRRRSVTALAGIGGLLCLAGAARAPLLLAVGGAAVALGVAVEVARALHAVRRRRLRTFWIPFPVAAVLVVAVGCWAFARSGSAPWLGMAAVLAMLVVGWLLRHLPQDSVDLLSARLPGAPETAPPAPRWPYGVVSLVLLGWLVLGFVLGLLGVLGLAAALLGSALLGSALVGAAAMLGAGWERGPFGRPTVQRALRAYAPRFVMPYNSYYIFHIAMWAPYLLRTGERVVVVTTDSRSFRELTRKSQLPVVFGRDTSRSATKALFPRSVRAAFYVHNGRHSHFLKVPGPSHVFLHHGDSDKHTSFAPVSIRYDLLVVAGQAAVDRYVTQGVSLDPTKFRLLGRPQTEGIEVVRSAHPIAPATVLYAPTWYPTTPGKPSYSSLLLGPSIVAALLASGRRVIFRPHAAMRSHPPAAAAIGQIHAMLAADAASTGHRHVYGRAADSLTVAQSTNLADAMISDVSGIVTDFMQSLKPYAMTVMIGTPDDFAARFPTSLGGYLLDRDLSDLASVLELMLGADPRAALRRERREYYLGPYSGDESARAFVDFACTLSGRARPAPIPTAEPAPALAPSAP